MIDKNKYFKFYNSCVPINGQSRSAIYDLQRGNIFFIPNSVINMLHENEGSKLGQLYVDYSDERLITKYISFLLENELIFLTDEPDNFPGMDLTFKKPFLLDILFLEIDSVQNSKMKLLEKLDDIGCVQLVLVSRDIINLKFLKKILHSLRYSKLQLINAVLKYDKKIVAEIKYLFTKNPRFTNVTFYNCSEENIEEDKNNGLNFSPLNLYHTLTRKVSSPNDFVVNLSAFIEAKKHNLFFNRKAYIENDGGIKHYVNDNNNYGNIESRSLSDVILSNSFQEIWGINKDKIEICNNCEFRYICPDNRIPIKVDDRYFHKTKCKYDPKSTLWN